MTVNDVLFTVLGGATIYLGLFVMCCSLIGLIVDRTYEDTH